MPDRKFTIALILAAGSIKLMACSGESARPAHRAAAPVSSISAESTKDTNESSLGLRNPRSLRKGTPHEAFLSLYNNPDEGISFRYPRNYSLEEGDVEERSYFLKRQEDLDIEQPGAALVATVMIPEDGYPNTTFEHGSLQVVINAGATEESCQDTSLLSSQATPGKRITVQGIVFSGSEQSSEMAGTAILERAYAGYSRGSCYEFLLTVDADAVADPDGFRKPADIAKIMKQLERIVSSTQVFEKSATPAAEANIETADRL